MDSQTVCERCEEDDADGDDHLCSPCRTIRENAAEQAWIDHENDKFFGGGR